MPTFKQTGYISYLIGLKDLDVQTTSKLIDDLKESKNIDDKLRLIKKAVEPKSVNNGNAIAMSPAQTI